MKAGAIMLASLLAVEVGIKLSHFNGYDSGWVCNSPPPPPPPFAPPPPPPPPPAFPPSLAAHLLGMPPPQLSHFLTFVHHNLVLKVLNCIIIQSSMEKVKITYSTFTTFSSN